MAVYLIQTVPECHHSPSCSFSTHFFKSLCHSRFIRCDHRSKHPQASLTLHLPDPDEPNPIHFYKACAKIRAPFWRTHAVWAETELQACLALSCSPSMEAIGMLGSLTVSPSHCHSTDAVPIRLPNSKLRLQSSSFFWGCCFMNAREGKIWSMSSPWRSLRPRHKYTHMIFVLKYSD